MAHRQEESFSLVCPSPSPSPCSTSSAPPSATSSDITLRALETLRAVDLIAAEDTRHSLRLLGRYEIRKPLVSFHEHNEARRTQELVGKLHAGATVALITDAGLPSISDPGARLVRACVEAGLPYTVIPGPSAVLTAVVGSGLSAERFFYGGFVPPKSGGRERDLLARVGTGGNDRLFRIAAPPGAHAGSARPAGPGARGVRRAGADEAVRGIPARQAAEVLAHYRAHPPKGEITLVIAGTGERSRRVDPVGE